jgi:hypothetical protein
MWACSLVDTDISEALSATIVKDIRMKRRAIPTRVHAAMSQKTTIFVTSGLQKVRNPCFRDYTFRFNLLSDFNPNSNHY